MHSTSKSNTIATGLAMFSMFFGAGNIVFPLAIGQYAQSKNFFAILGLLITAVGVPFIGLMSMTLFDGNYKNFFQRIGKVPGFLLSAFIMALIGPFGAIPRCIALSYSTIKIYVPDLSLPIFSLASCLVIYLCTFQRRNLLEILGYVLTPVLLISLLIIIIKGFMGGSELAAADHNSLAIFWHGFKEGYQTMDLLGAFFFSSIVLICLKKDIEKVDEKNHKRLIFLTLKAGCIGMGLLSATYIGFSYVASFHSQELAGLGTESLLTTLSYMLLGPYAGIITSVAVALTCLTTAIALSAVFAEFVHHDLTFNKANYQVSLIITLILSFFISILDFKGISAFLLPILQLCYPALIVLSIVNILFKLYHFKPVKVPVLITFLITLIGFLL